MDKQDISIGRRIRNLVVLSTGIAMAVVSLILAAYQIQNNVAARRAELISISYVYASAVAEDLANGDKAGIDRVFHSIAQLHDVVGVYALARDGQVMNSAGKLVILTSGMIDGEPDLLQMLTRGFMPVSVDVVRGGEHVGRLVIIGDISNIRTQLYKSIAATLFAGFTALALAQFLATRLQRRITAPIIRLTQTMTELTQAHRYETTAIPNAEGETKALVASFNGMISDIQTRDEALQKLAYFDALTELPNRTNFLRALDASFVEANATAGFAIYLIDLDNFGTINDTLGATLADALIISVSVLLKQAAEQGQFLARLTADEFALIAPGVTTLDEAQRKLAPFIAALYQPIQLAGQHIPITAGAGFALAGEHGKEASELLRHANLALSEAKRQGPGRVVLYFPELGERIEDEAQIERGLRKVIGAGELEVHYQPIVNTIDAVVEGFEALLRWRKPDGSFVPPAKFIPVAEKAGLIAELGEWVLRQACLDAAKWVAEGHRPRFVSVNISANQILLSNFMDIVNAALKGSKLPPGLLCLELTESTFIGRSMTLVRNVLQEAKALGVLTALDDFGTGYSSLSYLENLPFDKLKIDRSFVHQRVPGAKSRPLLKGIVDLAHALNIAIVAEGAELLEEVLLLKAMGAQSVQGYYFSRPLPASEALSAATRIEQTEASLVADQVSDEPVSGSKSLQTGN